MQPEDYFTQHHTIAQKQYEALRAFFIDKLSAKESAEKFGYTLRAFNSLVADFRKKLEEKPEYNEPFFQVKRPGRRFKKETHQLLEPIIELRKKNYSVGDIKTVLDSKNLNTSERYISLLLKKQGFTRLPRRSKGFKASLEQPKIEADKGLV